MEIDIYTTRTMMQAIELMKPMNTFLKDIFFKNQITFVTEAVDVDYYKGRRKMAPFVSAKLPGKQLEREGFTTKSFKPAMIKPNRVIAGDDISKRSLGESLYSSKTPEQRAAQMLAKDLAELDEMITRREEWMASQIMFTGKVECKGDGVNAVLDFDFTNKETLSGTSLWSDKTNSDPIKNLKNWRLSVLQKSGVTPDIVIMASNVVDAFINHPAVQKVMDISRITLGKIDPRVMPNGVTYLGSISMLGLDLYSYDEWYYDEDAAKEKPMVPEGKVMIASTRSRSSMAYGAINLINEQTKNFLTVEGSRVPDSWINKNPAARIVQVNSAPLPIPHEVDSWYVATVL